MTSSGKVLVTGGAGFIGYHLVRRLLTEYPNLEVISIDNLNSYYDIELKNDRLKELEKLGSNKYTFIELDITNRDALEDLFCRNSFLAVINLAAQAGVRYARENPDSYIKSNVEGFYNVASSAAKYKSDILIYASSSSVYGANEKVPFEESDLSVSPMSLYAATKLSNESLASSYYYTDGLPSAGLRFFNVYGPWGRPDMAYYKWSKNLVNNENIELRDNGEMYRDMTYVDDVINVINSFILHPDKNSLKHSIFNVGNESPVKIKDLLLYVQNSLSQFNSNVYNVEKGAEEPFKTFASTQRLKEVIGYSPSTSFDVGMDSFMRWFKEYYNIT